MLFKQQIEAGTLEEIYKFVKNPTQVQELPQGGDKWVLGKDSVEIESRDYDNSKIREYISYVSDFTSAIQATVITDQGSLQSQRLLRDISHIRFQKLLWLNLAGNKISSIEALSWLDAPELNRLMIENNYISHLSSIAKVNLRKFSYLTINDNAINHSEFNRLPRAGVSSEYINSVLAVDYQQESVVENIVKGTPKKPLILEDLSVVLKQQWEEMDFISISTERRIPQNKVIKALGSKYLLMTIMQL